MLDTVTTASGVQITIDQTTLEYKNAIEPLIDKLDTHRGALFASSFEYPGRYTCWDIGFYNPPLAIICKDWEVVLQSLNARGKTLLTICLEALQNISCVEMINHSPDACRLFIKKTEEIFAEEERSFQPSVFTVIRCLLNFFKLDHEHYLGLYGAFGYDLIYQFETLNRLKERPADQRDMVLYFPDEIYIVNHRKEEAFIRRYDFHYQAYTTQGLVRDGASVAYQAAPQSSALQCDHQPGEYADLVKTAKQKFACGDLFEVVLSQTFFTACQEQPSQIFRKMCRTNPSPYGFFINLGDQEYLVGASPEMYVRVQGRLVETCPISGTIQRGRDAMEDAKNIQTLLTSPKEESELTMCTDVDRNDKSRICEAGSVTIKGRRQIELYSKVIHTVDHVQGLLRAGFDAVDAFLTHMWVVTVTGAPKLWAMNFVEEYEKSPRRWYAGAVGWFGFDGNLNTGLVLRTLQIREGIANMRAGATLLFDSDPQAEEAETQLKASAFVELLQPKAPYLQLAPLFLETGVGKKVLLIDHQDSFVHTLANYFRQTGAEVTTIRFDKVITCLRNEHFDLAVLSPGPGRPADFKTNDTLNSLLVRDIPVFGVCLGLQAIVEYFGGVLDVLPRPVHGKASTIYVQQPYSIFAGLGTKFTAGRYHSLYARKDALPAVLDVTAVSEEGVVMAISHQSLPIHAVQFHPETLLSLPNQAGLHMIVNLMKLI